MTAATVIRLPPGDAARALLSDLPFLFSVIERGVAAEVEVEELLKTRGVKPVDFRRSLSQVKQRKRRADKRHAENERSRQTPADIADQYMAARGLRTSSGQPVVRSHNSQFYRYDGRRYCRAPEAELLADVLRYLRDNEKLRAHATSRLAAEVVQQVVAQVIVSGDISLPAWMGPVPQHAPFWVSFTNGLLDLGGVLAGGAPGLVPHDPRFFNRVTLSYPYDPTAQCLLWLATIESILPDPEVRALVQEWFGYNLVPITNLVRFVMLVGEGANGKSVVCTVLRELLGPENTSAVGLELFSPNSFALAEMDGKLANIVEEVGEMNRVAEGILKAIVAGNVTQVDRKFRDPFNMKPTARVTLAANTPPRFVDRTEGIWRRLTVVPFEQVFAKHDQDKRLISPDFWKNVGELPGILNWALEGLRRLMSRGEFPCPARCSAATTALRVDGNPARRFLEDECEIVWGAETASSELYAAYASWMELNGHTHPLSSIQFSKEVLRAFPGVVASNPRRLGSGTRTRFWMGIKRRI